MRSIPGLALVIIIITSTGLRAQYKETIQSSRPGQGFVPWTTGKNVFQIQTGITFDGSDNSDSGFSQNGFGYLLSFRYGLEEVFEIRTDIAARRDVLNTNDTETILDGISLWSLGLRFNIKDGKGDKASFAIQTDVRLNFTDEDYEIDEAAPRVLLLHAQNITGNLVLSTNWGISWDGITSSPQGLYVINLTFPLADKLGAFVETYGGVMKNDFTILFDTGLAYLVNNNLQLDISAGYGSNDKLRSTFIDLGVSLRMGNWNQPSSLNSFLSPPLNLR